MKVRLRRTGGFAGLVHEGEIDASRLPPGVVERLRAAAQGAATAPASSRARDAYRYRLELEREGGADSVEFGEDSMTRDQEAVVEAMEEVLKPVPLRKPSSGGGPPGGAA